MTMTNSTIVQARERDRGLRGFIRRQPIVSFFVLMIGAIILAAALLITTKGRLGYVPEVKAHTTQLS